MDGARDQRQDKTRRPAQPAHRDQLASGARQGSRPVELPQLQPRARALLAEVYLPGAGAEVFPRVWRPVEPADTGAGQVEC